MKNERTHDETNGNNPTGTNADMEQDSSDAPLGADEAPAFTTPVRVTFHHTRARLADIDGLSGKAVLDGIVEAGILSGDTAKQVTEVKHCQSKGKAEETRIVIEVI